MKTDFRCRLLIRFYFQEDLAIAHFELSEKTELVTIINKTDQRLDFRFKSHVVQMDELSVPQNSTSEFCIEYLIKLGKEMEKRNLIPLRSTPQLGISLSPDSNPNGHFVMHKVGRPGSNQFLIIDPDTVDDIYVQRTDTLLKIPGWKRIITYVIDISQIWGDTIPEFRELMIQARPWLYPHRLHPIGTYSQRKADGTVMQTRTLTCRRHCLNNPHWTRIRHRLPDLLPAISDELDWDVDWS